MKNDKLSNYLGLCLLAGLALVVGAFFVIKPSIHRSDASKLKISAVNADIAALHTLQSQTDVLRQKYAVVKDKRDQILHQLPSKSEEERLLALFSSLGQQSGVVVSSFLPAGSSTPTSSSILTYGVSISAGGSYAQMQNFLKLVENSARFIDVESASFSGGVTGLSASLSVQAYYQSDISPTVVGGAK